jgi:hypothetical protein
LDGYFSTKDKRDLDELTVHLFVTKDGAYAVCVGDAWWLKRVNGNAVGNSRADNIVTLVDLSTLKIANRIHTKDLNLFDEFQEVRLDANGRILVVASTLGHSQKGAFTQLAIPSLVPGAKCEYSSFPDKTGTMHAVDGTDESCHKSAGDVSLESYLATDQPVVPRDPPFKCTDTGAEYCPEPYEFTRDHRFGLGLRTQGRDALFGGWVETRAVAVVFSTETRSEIGELDLDTRGDSGPLLENVDKRIYLLVLRNSTQLRVYGVSGSSD